MSREGPNFADAGAVFSAESGPLLGSEFERGQEKEAGQEVRGESMHHPASGVGD